LTGLAASSLLLRLLQCLLDLILDLLTQRLQRFVDLALDLFASQLEGLLHLLAHGLGDLSLQLAEDGLDGLTDLLLKCLTKILVVPRRCLLIVLLLGGTVAGF